MILSGFAADAIMSPLPGKTLATVQIGGGSAGAAAIAQMMIAKTPMTKGAALPATVIPFVVTKPDPIPPPAPDPLPIPLPYIPEATIPEYMLKGSCEAAGRTWDGDHKTCLPKAYTDALEAQANDVLDLGDSFFDKLPKWAIWAPLLGVVGYAIYRKRQSASPVAGYRRRRRRR